MTLRPDPTPEPLREPTAGPPPTPSTASTPSTPLAVRAPESLVHRARASLLVELLADESPRVVAGVRMELRRMGRTARGALRRARDSGSARLRGRARQFLLEQARRRAIRRLVRHAAGGAQDLERALFLLDAYGVPGEDLRGYVRVLDGFGHRLRERLGRTVPGRGARVLVDYLAGEVGFAGCSQEFHHPDNIYVHRVIDRREGMPLTLCAIYACVARRVGLEVGVLPFPGHVLLAVTEGGERTIVDPFGGGEFLSHSQCLRYLARQRIPYRAEYFRCAPDGDMFVRHVGNLIQSMRVRKRGPEAADLALVQRAYRGSGERG